MRFVWLSSRPGLKIPFLKQDVLAQFPDAFTPYLTFGCTLKSYFNGTLFRFPLRYGHLTSPFCVSFLSHCQPSALQVASFTVVQPSVMCQLAPCSFATLYQMMQHQVCSCSWSLEVLAVLAYTIDAGKVLV
jgi:hypothetical protein